MAYHSKPEENKRLLVAVYPGFLPGYPAKVAKATPDKATLPDFPHFSFFLALTIRAFRIFRFFFRLRILLYETAPEKLLHRYEKRFEKREKRIRKTIRNAFEKF